MFDEHYQVRQVVDHFGRSLRTIRHFEEIGLGHSSGCTEGGFRHHSDYDVDQPLVQVEA